MRSSNESPVAAESRILGRVGSGIFTGLSDARAIDAVVILGNGRAGRLNCESSGVTGTGDVVWIVVGSVVGGAFSVGSIDHCVLLPIELG